MTRRTRVLVTTTAAALMGLAFPAVATETPSTLLGAAGGVRYWESTTQLAESDDSTPTVQQVSASCGQGWQAVAGGMSVGARTGQGISDAWSGNNVDWSVSAWQRDAPESSLASFAVCMKTDELSSVTESS